MTFNLIFFICFSLIAILLYHTLAQNYSNIFLLVISVAFYLLIDYRHTLILAASIVVTYYLVEIANTLRGRKRKLVSGIAISFVVLMLAFYKYFSNLFSGFEFATAVIMPMGISYFSFKMISYIVDLGLKGENEKNIPY